MLLVKLLPAFIYLVISTVLVQSAFHGVHHNVPTVLTEMAGVPWFMIVAAMFVSAPFILFWFANIFWRRGPENMRKSAMIAPVRLVLLLPLFFFSQSK